MESDRWRDGTMGSGAKQGRGGRERLRVRRRSGWDLGQGRPESTSEAAGTGHRDRVGVRWHHKHGQRQR